MEDIMSETPERSYFSTVPISQPVVVPSAEDYDMNGFVWSNEFGIKIKMNRSDDPEPDIMKTLREVKKHNRDWLENL